MKITNKKSKKKKIPKGQHSIYELLSFKKREEDGSILLKDGSYLAFLKVIPQSLNNLNSAEKERAMEQFNILERIYDADHSILSLRFPPNVEEPLLYWNKMLNKGRQNHDLSQVRSAQKQIEKMYLVSKKLPNQEFFFMIYADTRQELEERKKQIISLGGKILSLHSLNNDEIDELIFQLMNMNTVIG